MLLYPAMDQQCLFMKWISLILLKRQFHKVNMQVHTHCAVVLLLLVCKYLYDYKKDIFKYERKYTCITFKIDLEDTWILRFSGILLSLCSRIFRLKL